ncbi:RNAse P Rpr2/Rpp21/SNM1 subunit domain-containing protein [Elsinoe fawcettii]|nr:RNAse P Rpr2/Rpp21/SNM1 subunit domain-containing protein [Elsinoe fawcettii]
MSKGPKARHLQARVAYLDRAAKLLAGQQFSSSATEQVSPKTPGVQQATAGGSSANNTGLPLLFSSHMRTVAKRGQVRIAQEVKRSLCKICNTPLLEGKTCSSRIENASKGGNKPQADVKTVECMNCGGVKRFPGGVKRQAKRSQRSDAVKTDDQPKRKTKHVKGG